MSTLQIQIQTDIRSAKWLPPPFAVSVVGVGEAGASPSHVTFPILIPPPPSQELSPTTLPFPTSLPFVPPMSSTISPSLILIGALPSGAITLLLRRLPEITRCYCYLEWGLMPLDTTFLPGFYATFSEGHTICCLAALFVEWPE
ncbi:hypothetical protein REPUB_Repub04eG0156900 [Reevesia pubescens]